VNTELWRGEAARRFPDLLGKLAEADSPGMFWIDLHFEFEDAYDAGRPERVAAIYGYAKWCCEQPQGKTAADDLGSIVATHLFEHIPAHPRALADMPNWWTIEEVRLMKEIFSYMVGEGGYAQVLAQFGVK
jgi:hypothetical protein